MNSPIRQLLLIYLFVLQAYKSVISSYQKKNKHTDASTLFLRDTVKGINLILTHRPVEQLEWSIIINGTCHLRQSGVQSHRISTSRRSPPSLCTQSRVEPLFCIYVQQIFE